MNSRNEIRNPIYKKMAMRISGNSIGWLPPSILRQKLNTILPIQFAPFFDALSSTTVLAVGFMTESSFQTLVASDTPLRTMLWDSYLFPLQALIVAYNSKLSSETLQAIEAFIQSW